MPKTDTRRDFEILTYKHSFSCKYGPVDECNCGTIESLKNISEYITNLEVENQSLKDKSEKCAGFD